MDPKPYFRNREADLDPTGDWTDLFLDKIDASSIEGCWTWKGYTAENGYGVYKPKGRMHESYFRAHRLSYLVFNGPIPDGYHVHHKCNNPSCCNPDHLEAVTPKRHIELTPECVSHKASKVTHCPRGHPYDEKNTLYKSSGKRYCRECNRIAKKAAYVPKPPRTHCQNGHEFTEENTYQYNGHRACRKCRSERSIRWQKENRERNLQNRREWRRNNPDKVRAQKKRARDRVR